jgi:hypothetical protein
MLTNRDELADRYAKALQQVWELHNLSGLSAAIYTQTADVETECNGLQTYDRAITKIDPNILLAANLGKFSRSPKKIILPDALYGRPTWKYTTDKPADNWCQPDFDASSWKEGVGGFGTAGTPGIFLNTTWGTDDIWLRRSFTVAAKDISHIKFQIFHDEDVEVYLNGVLAVQLPGFITDYDEFDISKEAVTALHPGDNTIAVHCHQTIGGQGVDVGIIVPDLPGKTEKN